MDLKAVFQQLQGKRVIVIGDIIVDRYVWGQVNRISPEAPVPVFETVTERSGCGGAANVAQNVASLGGTAILVGVIGRDREGDTLTRLLAETNLSTAGIATDPQRPTSTKSRLIAQSTDGAPESGHHLLRIDRESRVDVSPQIEQQLLDTIVSRLPKSDAIIFADYDKGVVTRGLIRAVTKEAKAYGTPIVVDPKRDNFWHYEGVTAITPNDKEARAAVDEKTAAAEDLVAVGADILNRLSLEGVLITRDAEGMSLFQRAGDGRVTAEHLPPASHSVTDVTGAGDTAIAAFTLALAAKAGFRNAALLSNLAGGIAVGKMGCATVTPKELLNAIAALPEL